MPYRMHTFDLQVVPGARSDAGMSLHLPIANAIPSARLDVRSRLFGISDVRPMDSTQLGRITKMAGRGLVDSVMDDDRPIRPYNSSREKVRTWLADMVARTKTQVAGSTGVTGAL